MIGIITNKLFLKWADHVEMVYWVSHTAPLSPFFEETCRKVESQRQMFLGWQECWTVRALRWHVEFHWRTQLGPNLDHTNDQPLWDDQVPSALRDLHCTQDSCCLSPLEVQGADRRRAEVPMLHYWILATKKTFSHVIKLSLFSLHFFSCNTTYLN